MIERARTAAAAPAFQNLVVAVIVANAVVLGLETYDGVDRRYGDLLTVLDRVFVAFFVVELLVRITAAGFSPRRFLRSGWNVFDTLVVVASVAPGLPANSTALRLVRLLRVTRLLRLMPDLRVLLDGVRRAAPPAASLLALTVLIVYVYAVLGWTIFAESAPQYFDDVGEGMLTLFTLLTLEGWNEILGTLREASPWALPYVLSFILVGTFVVLNLVIGVIINSLDEAYGERRREREGAQLADAITSVRNALDQLEATLDAPADLHAPRRPEVLDLQR